MGRSSLSIGLKTKVIGQSVMKNYPLALDSFFFISPTHRGESSIDALRASDYLSDREKLSQAVRPSNQILTDKIFCMIKLDLKSKVTFFLLESWPNC